MQRATWSRVRSSGGPAGVFVSLGVAPALLFVVGGVVFVVVGNVIEHEAAAFAVAQDSAFAAHAFGNEDAGDADGPDHAGGMKLHELHVLQLGSGAIGEGKAVTGVLPAIAGDFEGAADASGGDDDGFGLPELEETFLAIVSGGADDTAGVHEQVEDGALHVYFHAAVDAVVLQGADHFEAGAVADVGEARIFVTAKVTLQDAAVLGAVEERAPGFELADALGSFSARGARPCASC